MYEMIYDRFIELIEPQCTANGWEESKKAIVLRAEGIKRFQFQ